MIDNAKDNPACVNASRGGQSLGQESGNFAELIYRSLSLLYPKEAKAGSFGTSSGPLGFADRNP